MDSSYIKLITVDHYIGSNVNESKMDVKLRGTVKTLLRITSNISGYNFLTFGKKKFMPLKST